MPNPKLAIEVTKQGERFLFTNQTDAEIYKQMLKRLAGKTATLSLDEAKPKRSQQAANYYFHLCSIVADRINFLAGEPNKYNTDNVHALFKQEILTNILHERGALGNVFTIFNRGYVETIKIQEVSTKKLTVEVFSEYLEKIMFWVQTRLDLTLPPPKTEQWRNLKYISI